MSMTDPSMGIIDENEAPPILSTQSSKVMSLGREKAATLEPLQSIPSSPSS